MKNSIPLKKITEVFNRINSNDIISLAKKIQKQLKSNKNLIKNNNNPYKVVTKADIEIQKYLLNYFENSPLKDTYNVIAEEKLKRKINDKAQWNLIIDPLDGTSSFINQKYTWGVMIGACDIKGILRYSYNIISSGVIYKTENTKKIKFKSFKQIKESRNKIAIDVYDYDNGVSNRFNSQFCTTSYPSAIWAGWQLYQQKIDGLLWLPSNKGKKMYPNYDLIFLGVILDMGYNIIIGKNNNNNSMIAIGPTLKDSEKLFQIGLSLLPIDQRNKMKKIVNKLKIIN